MSFFNQDLSIPPAGRPQQAPSEDVSHLAGGTLRATTPGTGSSGIPRGQPPVHWEASRVIGGTLQMVNGQEVQQASHASHAMTFDGTPGGSVMATLQNVGAAGKTVELIPGQPGSRTSLAVALREGVIREAHPGVYEDISGAPQAIEQSMQQQAEEQGPAHDPGEAVFDQADSEVWDDAISGLPQHSYDGAVAAVTSAVIGGRSLEDAAKTLSATAHLEPALAREYVEAGAAMHERVVARAVDLSGDRKEAFYAYCRTQPRDLQQAIQELTTQRNPAKFKAMAADFNRHHHDHSSAKAMQAAGFSTRFDHDGALMVQYGAGNWVPARALGRG